MAWTASKGKEMIPIEEMVDTIFRNHPEDCFFTPNARENIIKKLKEYTYNNHSMSQKEFAKAVDTAFKDEEVYCPHENIDRREEFGML